MGITGLRFSLFVLTLVIVSCYSARFPGEYGRPRYLTVEVTNRAPMDARLVVSGDGQGHLAQAFVEAQGRARFRIYRGVVSRLIFDVQPIGSLGRHRIGSILLGDASQVVVEIPSRWTNGAVVLLR